MHEVRSPFPRDTDTVRRRADDEEVVLGGCGFVRARQGVRSGRHLYHLPQTAGGPMPARAQVLNRAQVHYRGDGWRRRRRRLEDKGTPSSHDTLYHCDNVAVACGEHAREHVGVGTRYGRHGSGSGRVCARA